MSKKWHTKLRVEAAISAAHACEDCDLSALKQLCWWVCFSTLPKCNTENMIILN